MNEHYENQEPKSPLEEVDWEAVASETGFEPLQTKYWNYVFRIYQITYFLFMCLVGIKYGVPEGFSIFGDFVGLNILFFLIAGLLSFITGIVPFIKQPYWKRVNISWAILTCCALIISCVFSLSTLIEKQRPTIRIPQNIQQPIQPSASS